MKISIEQSDIDEVKNVASDWYSVVLTDEQARKLIEDNAGLASELFECDGHLDTQGRESLSSALVDHVLDGEPPPTNKPKYGSGWSWPLYGDTEMYKTEFDEKFKTCALKKGIQLRGENTNGESSR